MSNIGFFNYNLEMAKGENMGSPGFHLSTANHIEKTTPSISTVSLRKGQGQE